MKKLAVIMVVGLVVLATAAIAVGFPYAVSGPFPPSRNVVPETYPSFTHVTVFPEGCIAYGFETWIILFNGGTTPAQYIVSAYGGGKYFVVLPEIIGSGERVTLDMRYCLIDKHGENQDYAEHFAQNPNISFKVYFNKPGICAQESMYWNNRTAGHTSTGIVQ